MTRYVLSGLIYEIMSPASRVILRLYTALDLLSSVEKYVHFHDELYRKILVIRYFFRSGYTNSCPYESKIEMIWTHECFAAVGVPAYL